jgi:hypothetical protein
VIGDQPSDDDDRRFEMLYCDEIRCRVNEFERGRPIMQARCPGCGTVGLPIPDRAR